MPCGDCSSVAPGNHPARSGEMIKTEPRNSDAQVERNNLGIARALVTASDISRG
jgi:hypothetical protein